MAAFLLVSAATGSVFLWNNWTFDFAQFAINAAVALIGFVVLHFRWREQERRTLSKGQVKDIFS